MRALIARIVAVAALCSGCSSPSAPSSSETTYELRITESPSCAAQATPGNFFLFGTKTVHVKGSFSAGTFLLVDDSLAVFGSQCSSTSRPELRLDVTAGPGAVAGRMDGGVWSPSSCIGSYVGAQGTVSGTRDAASASGLLNRQLVSGIFALNSAGSCSAIDHTWSLKPASS